MDDVRQRNRLLFHVADQVVHPAREHDVQQHDWNGDGQFGQLDVVAALQAGRYLAVPAAARRGASESLATDVDELAGKPLVDIALETLSF